MFLAPYTLIGLALVVLPVAIHLLVKRRGKRLDFPSLKFLRETPSFRLHPRRIRQPLLLALRAAALALLILGLARPLIPFAVATRRTRIILMDASLSMNARGRTEAAREQARAIINRLSNGERAALVSFTSDIRTLAPPTSDRRKLSEAVADYRPVAGCADYRVALARVEAMLEQEQTGAAEIDIISDFQQSGFAGQSVPITTPPARIVTFPVGTEVERNAFIVDERLAKRERGLELSASEIISEKDGRGGARRSWLIDRRDNALSDIEWRTETNEQVMGRWRVLAPDDFDADDERFFAFAPGSRGRVLLVEKSTDESIYLRAALEAATGEGGTSRVALDHKNALPDDAHELDQYALVVLTLHGVPVANETRKLLDYAHSGGSVWITLGRDMDASAWNAFAQTEEGRELPFNALTRASDNRILSFATIDDEAPALRLFGAGSFDTLRTVRVRVGYAMSPRAGVAVSTLLRWSDNTPGFMSARVGAGNMLVLATSPERAASDLGLSAAFPTLASSILNDALTPRETFMKEVGEPVDLRVAPETNVKIIDAEGRTQQAEARSLMQKPLNFFERPGIYRLEFAARTSFIAFNAPVAESERALAASEQIKTYFPAREDAPSKSSDARRDALERHGNIWRYLFCAAFLLLIAELLFAMHHRQKGGPVA
jgi:hypothetical protein